MLDELLPSLSQTEQNLIREVQQEFETPGADREVLQNAVNKVFELEKRLVPQLNQAAVAQIRCDTLICPVGLRAAPVILTILCLKPRWLFLLHTEGSQKIAEKVRDDPDVAALDPRITLKEINETDIVQNYNVIQKEILPRAKGHIIVDVTGGVKIMGVSLSAMAFWRRLAMVYLKGEEVRGIVRPFTETIACLKNPYDHFGDREFALIETLFKRGNYNAAAEVCRNLRGTVGDSAKAQQLLILERLIDLYHDWDLFKHSSLDETGWQLGSKLEEILNDMRRLNVNLVNDEKVIEENITFLYGVEDDRRKHKAAFQNQIDPQRIVDVYCNAERRAELGQYDDAVARLYRCLEMCATHRLQTRWEINSTRDPRTAKIFAAVDGEETFRKAYREKMGYELPAKRWGLNDQMGVLWVAEPDNRAAKTYFEMGHKGDENPIEFRNRSILAHGTVPVTANEYNLFRRKTETIVRFFLENEVFNDLRRKCQFPTLRL